MKEYYWTETSSSSSWTVFLHRCRVDAIESNIYTHILTHEYKDVANHRPHYANFLLEISQNVSWTGYKIV